MTSPRQRAIAALERWRGFQEARAEAAQRAARRDADVARDIFEHSRANAVQAEQQRLQLLVASALDLPRWQAAATIEGAMWAQVAEEQQQLELARERMDEAAKLHRDAHVLTEVVVTRRERQDAAEHDLAEKTAFDRMLELRAVTVEARND